MQFQRIEDYSDSRLDAYRELKNTNPLRCSEGFIAEGKLVVERLLQSGLEIISVLVSEKRIEKFAEKLRRDVAVWVVPHAMASELVGFNFHAGILAHGKRPASFRSEAKQTQLQAWANRPSCTIIACPNTTLPDNLGSIIRLAAAFGAHGMIVTPKTADPYSRRCVRVSMGNIFQLPTIESSSVVEDFHLLQQHRFQIIACHQSPSSLDVRQFLWPEKVVLVLGNEATGIPPDILADCNQHLEIPIASTIDSLNVSTAAAIMLYERSRQGEREGFA
jgi:tRNA G18 (ribose-2'-O)-methylase SpoU